MKKFGLALIISVVIFIIASVSLGKMSIYDPMHESVRVTVSEVEKGNNLINVTEIEAILFVMIAGALIIFK